MSETATPQKDPVSVSALKRGEDGAWDAFFDAHNDLILAVVRWPKWHFKPDDHDDIAQEIRSELMRSVMNFRQDSSLRYYVKRICINRCIDRIRRQVRERSIMVSLSYRDADGHVQEMDAPAGAASDPVREIYVFESVCAVRELLGSLDKTCRQAIELFYLNGLAYREIADQLKISINTVGSRLAKCLGKLRRNARNHPVLREESGAPGDIAS